MREATRAARRDAWTRFGYYVIFFGLHYGPVPTFHRPRGWEAAGIERDEQGLVAERIERTRCGRVWSHWTTLDGYYREIIRRDPFPSEHAVKFGRPCARCWPG